MSEPNPPLRFPDAYLVMAQQMKSGDMGGARATLHWIKTQLDQYVPAMLHESRRRCAEGRHDAALECFDLIFEAFRLNLTGLTLPVSKAQCFEQIADLFAALGQPFAEAAARRLAAATGESFYRPSGTCQIHVLPGLYEQLFGERTDGSFVEVGAYDGETFSNTSCLADLGWRGLYLEPIRESFERCQERHRRNPAVQVMNYAIGVEAGSVRFWENGQFSTGSEDEVAVNLANRWLAGAGMMEIEVPQIRLDTALERAGMTPRFDLLVVDVDGMEEQVFAGFDLERWRPRHMIIELIETEPNFIGHESLIAASGRVRETIHRAGYEQLYRDSRNTLFRDPGAA